MSKIDNKIDANDKTIYNVLNEQNILNNLFQILQHHF